MKRLFIDIWTSLRALPLWVQLWVFGILVPVNMAALFFLGEVGGWIVAILAVGGMLPNVVLILVQRGFSKAMALSHVLLWGPLLILIALLLLNGPIIGGGYLIYLWILFGVDLFSLGFDVIDSIKWYRGDRDIARQL